jgi:hypothetical protein
MFNPKIGDWVQFKGKFARVHGATKGGRFLIEVHIDNGREVFREWVRPLNITPLDPAVGSILESIHEAV